METEEQPQSIEVPLNNLTGLEATPFPKVPNKQPTLTAPYRIAIIGEAPGKDEVHFGQPFVGMSGKHLTQILQKRGIVREALFIGNVMQIQPPKTRKAGKEVQLGPYDKWTNTTQGDLEHLRLPALEYGLSELAKDLDAFKPNICLLLGGDALQAAKGVDSIMNWRGSLFLGEQNCFIGRKCLASYHPAACLRQYDWTPLLMFDVYRCLEEARFPELTLPERTFYLNLTSNEIIERLQRIQHSKSKIALDIEGGINSWSCISIATSPSDCFIIPFTRSNGEAYWSQDDEVSILLALSLCLADTSVPKILQNSLYDRFVLQYSYNILVLGTIDDTMLKAWERHPELDKGLGFLCSLYTRQPYYKSDRKSDDLETFWRYCCMDSATTYEISEKLDSLLDAKQREHYQFNIEFLDLLLYCELTGMLYDTPEAKKRLSKINHFIYRLQYQLNKLAGLDSYTERPAAVLETAVREVCCFKRDPSKCKKGFEEDFPRVIELLTNGRSLTEEEKGYISIVCGWDMNVKSPDYKDFLYKDLKLPEQHNRDSGAVSTDSESLLKLQKKSPHEAVALGIQIMELRTRAQMLSIYADSDGRIRTTYNIVGTVTGRLSSYTSPTGSGYNLQTIPDDYKSLGESHPLYQGMRDLFLADDGYWMFQCDLKGADGWTIGAHLYRLGDSSMLEDLRFGIKPAARCCYILRHGVGSIAGRPRVEVKELLKEVKKDAWDYFAMKIGIWGQAYTLGPDLQAMQIAEESYGQVNLTRKEVEELRSAVFATYNIRLWHKHAQRLIDKPGFPKITSASGNTRTFFGRKQNILGDYLSHEPQNNTTYAVKLAARNLWTDPENRRTESEAVGGVQSHLRIQPLHTVHDSLNGQFRKEDTTWAVSKVKQYFANQIIIAGIPMVIPFEGTFGRYWGDDSGGVI